MDLNAQLVWEEVLHPEVVVSGEVLDVDSPSDESFQCKKNGEIPTRNDGWVLKPEIEEIAQDVEFGSGFLDVFQELEEKVFLCSLFFFFLQAQVGVGDEEDGVHRFLVKTSRC